MSDFGFVLDEFANDSAELTAKHRRILDGMAFEIRHTIREEGEVWLIHLVGSASQIGKDDYNLELSKRRARSVQNYLDRQLMGVSRRYRAIGIGEAGPEDAKIISNPRDRSVSVRAQLTGRIPPRPITIDVIDLLKPQVLHSKDFSLQIISYLMQSVGIPPFRTAKVAMNFIIGDGKTEAKFTFMGEGKDLAPTGGLFGGARSMERGKPQTFGAVDRLAPADFTGKGETKALMANAFHIGEMRGPISGLRDFPMGTVRKFTYPKSFGNPSLLEFDGAITKGFDPLVPEFPAKLPASGIF